MNHSKKCSPAIRIKGFTDDWEQRKLGEIGNTYTGLSGKTKDDFGYGDAKYITYLNVYSNTISSIGMVDRIKQDDLQNQVLKGDVLFTTSSETPEEVGLSSVWTYDLPNVYLNSFCFGFRLHQKVDLNYLAYMLRSKNIRSQMILLAQGISRYNISKKSVMNITIFLPNLEEQTQIGNFFKQLDETIALHKRTLEKHQNLKKFYLEKMFPKENQQFPEIRFPNFTDAWEQRKLGEVVEFYSGLTYSPNHVSKQGTLVLRSSNVHENQIVTNDNVFVRSNIINSPNVDIGDIIVVVRNGSRNLIGKHAIIQKIMPNTVIGAFMAGIRYKNPDFLVALLDTQLFNKEIEKNLGATINQITTGSFKNMVFHMPNLEEQTQIGNFFKQLDETIALHKRKVEKFEKIKQAYLEKMFI